MADVEHTDFEINRLALDDEWVRQPDLYRRYAEDAADARRLFDEAKNTLTVTRAEVEMDVRENPEDHGLAKVTETAVKTAVEMSAKVQLAEKEVIKTRYAMEVLQGALGALDHKKKALGDLVSLHLADYFSEPKARPSGREETETYDKRRARKSQRRRRDDD
jgi:hypothetical protein